ncbi:hypothetical protein Tco_1191003, partial [Tanacetum coccineum]
EMVLVIQRLSTLGDILSNFKELRMEFEHNAEEPKDKPEVISKLLDNYIDVFAIATAFPPIRPCDHQIPLKEELLNTKMIRDSQSPFFSPVIMVKRKDGTWRMCIDYRKLNNATIKDKFPIHVIEELIDELQGS